MPIISAYFIGLVFGLGIVISGMANPAKVLNFFDIAETWDPSLAFVMGGALAVTFPGYRLVLKRAGPRFGDTFHLPVRQTVDARLLAGASVFGVGWGLSGFCPGGALPALGTGNPDVIVYVSAMIPGILIARIIQARTAPPEAAIKS